jgi:hypothetical protein
MNVRVVPIPAEIERPDQTRSLGRELAELVDEWSVTPNGVKAQKIASEMIGKARELLRTNTYLPKL